jgi:pimeloyl-ACP methyl ester carboxylesterase
MTATAMFFGDPARPRFGWLYVPRDGASGIGVVIVPPFGFEAICAHRTLRHLAEDSVARGMIAVRFDLDGTGDSAGDDLERGRLEAWIASIADACDLARQAGANRIVLVGLRLGATLAALAAARRRDVSAVVAIAATPSGKAIVREQRMLQASLGQVAPPGVAAAVEAPDECCGFAVTPETRTALSQIDLLKATQAPAPNVLLVDRDDQKGNEAWARALEALGARATVTVMTGYVEMMADPHKTTLPREMIEAVCDYAQVAPVLASPAPAPRDLATSDHAVFGDAREDIVRLDSHLFAIASAPAGAGKPEGRALVLLNAGGIHHVGPNRLHVVLARRLAGKGVLVVRADQSGLGDSRTRAGSDENVVYSDHAVRDAGVAIAWAKARAQAVTAGGLCSGAYHAYRAAAQEAPLHAIVPINPLTFRWVPGTPLDVQSYKIAQDANRYGSSMRSARAWKKLASGEVDIRRIASVVARRAVNVAEHRLKDVARRMRVPLPHDLGTDLLAFGRRGVAVHFVFASGEPGITLLADGGGSAVGRLEQQGALDITTIEGPDHTFTPRWSHEPLLAAIEAAIR